MFGAGFGLAGAAAGWGYNAYQLGKNAGSFLNISNAVSRPFYPSIFSPNIWAIGGTVGGNLIGNVIGGFNQI
jgi:hypothetical protein